MKAIELKLGDCVSYKGKVAKIHSIDSPCIYVDVDDEIWGTPEDDDELSPIPLTEEILEKNGWEKGDWCLMKGLLELIPFADKTKGLGFSIYKGVRIHNIEYVHQLQHLLWALGMDDDLKI